VSGPSARTLAAIRANVDEIVLVGEEAIARAVLLLVEKAKFVVEGAGALAVAALQCGAYRPSAATVAVLSGGNIDINLLGSIVRRGLVEAGRYRHLALAVADVPGALAGVSGVIAEQRANILEVTHDRESPDTPVGIARLDFVLEVRGDGHFREVEAALRDAGYMPPAPGNV
jgi:threonine dehydratase